MHIYSYLQQKSWQIRDFPLNVAPPRLSAHGPISHLPSESASSSITAGCKSTEARWPDTTPVGSWKLPWKLTARPPENQWLVGSDVFPNWHFVPFSGGHVIRFPEYGITWQKWSKTGSLEKPLVGNQAFLFGFLSPWVLGETPGHLWVDTKEHLYEESRLKRVPERHPCSKDGCILRIYM